MALKITDACIGCGTCVDSCPVNAIIESGDIFTITDDCADDSNDCRACVDICPVGAIVD